MVKIPFVDGLTQIVLNEKVAGKIVEIGVDRIYPNPNQPRRFFNENELRELANSIRSNGMIQPITVRRLDVGYEIVTGERRYRAARMCGYEVVPCIVVETTERNSAIMALVENLQRKDLHFFEEAEAISNMISTFGITQEDAAIRLGKSQSAVANKLRLLKLNRKERKLITDYGFTERHARALLKVEDEALRDELIEQIYSEKMNVEGTERLIEKAIGKHEELNRISRCRGAYRDVKLFLNTIDHAIEVMQAAGINAEVRKNKEKEYIEYIVRIPSIR